MSSSNAKELSQPSVASSMSKSKEELMKDIITPMATVHTTLIHSFGFESNKRNNIFFVSGSEYVVVSAGNTLKIVDVRKSGSAGSNYYILEVSGTGGIGPIAVFDKYLAVAEKGEFPKVIIYDCSTLPTIEPVRKLEKGTNREYTAMCFNNDGSRIATVGGFPDYMLTIWNWDRQQIVLRTKAFGQDVFCVSFSPFTDGILTTSGIGHIKFWKMSHTFTGLKLQGLVGKFGKVDISDISGYVELPDGKVLSGSEQGDLLLWDANLIKIIFRQSGGKKCHNGAVEVVYHDPSSNNFVTAGMDGYIRYWNFEQIDTAESGEADNVVEIAPVEEILVNEQAKIFTLVPKDNFWVAQDAGGAMWKIQKRGTGGYKSQKLLEFHAGGITGLAAAPNDHVAATVGADGTVRLVNYLEDERRTLFMRRFNSSATCVQWNPPSVDSSGLTITVGFADGIIRILKRCDDEWDLMKVFKPHTAAIKCFAYTRDGKMFVTSGADSILFFFETKGYVPLGYIKMSSVVTSIMWNLSDKGALLTLMDGQLLELQRPDPAKIDNSKKYEFTGTFKKYLYHQRIRPLPKPKKKSKVENLDEDEEKKPPADHEDEEQKEEEKEEEREDIESETFETVPALYAMYNNIDSLWVVLQKKNCLFQYSGACWEDDIHTTPEYPFKMVFDYPAICTVLQYSSSLNYVVIAYDDGKVFLMDLKEASTVKQTKALHDSFYGRITGACTSFDDSYLLSVGMDGCFFVQKIDLIPTRTPENPPTLQMAIKAVQDITDPNHWSIQEYRIKEEERGKQEATEKRKTERRRELDDLKYEYKKNWEINKTYETQLQLSRDEFQLDPRIKDMMHKKLDEKLFAVRKEMEWDSAKLDLQHQKLQRHYIDVMEVERIELKAFKSGKKVASFRTTKIYEELQRHIDTINKSIQDVLAQKSISSQSQRLRPGQQSDSPDMLSPERYSDSLSTPKKHSPAISAAKKGIMRKLSWIQGPSTREKAEEIRRQRDERSNRRAELIARKPNDAEEDPEIMREINYFKNNMGDIKLKTDPNYIVPESQRVTTEKKLKQMVLLVESSHTLRMVFNSRVSAMKDLKRRLVEKFKKINEQVAEINQKLGIKEPLFNATIEDSEFPENRRDRDKISLEEVLKYEKQKQREEKKKKLQQQGVSGLNAMMNEEDEQQAEVKTTKSEKSVGKKSRKETGKQDPKGLNQNISEMEYIEQQINREKLLYEKQRLLKKQDKQIESYDNAIDDLRREKFKLDADLKNADLKLLLLYQEFELLKEYELKDRDLLNELARKRQEKTDINQQIHQLEIELNYKKKEIEQILQQEKIMTEFVTLVPKEHPAHEELFKIFKKSKSDEDSDDSDKEDSSGEGDSDSEGEEERPDKCDEALFQKILVLRKKRIEQEKLVENIAKGVKAIKANRTTLSQKEKAVKIALEAIEKDIEDVQKEKQHKLNEIQTIVFLKLSQIQSLVQHKIPADLSGHVVTTNEALKRLASRIKELKEERKELSQRNKNELKEYNNLLAEKKKLEESLNKAKASVVEVQLLKFGQEVNLEELEDASVDTRTDELRMELQKVEREAEVELNKWDQKISMLKEKLTETTRQNTSLLDQLGDLREKQQNLETELDLSQTTIVKRIQKGIVGGTTTAKDNALEALKAHVEMQKKQLEDAKNEIAILRSKSTHMFTSSM